MTEYRGYKLIHCTGLIDGERVYVENVWGELIPCHTMEYAQKMIDNFEDVVDQLCAQSE